jgi:hypothetical protein
MTTLTPTILTCRETSSQDTPSFSTSARALATAFARCVAALIGLLIALALVSSPAASSPGYPDMSAYRWFTSLASSGWVGGDGTRSVRLPDGRSAWLFSDTIAASSRAGLRFVHNSIVITGQRRPHVILNPLPSLADGSYFWPGAARVRGSKVWVLAQRIVPTGPGLWDFHLAGIWLGQIDISRWRLVSLRPVAQTTCQINWSSALFDSGPHTYIYGLETNGLARWLHVARVPRGRLDLRWRFYTGTGWTANSQTSARVLGGVSVVSMLDLGSRGLRLVSQQPVLGRIVYSWHARSPVGPFTIKRAIYDTGSFGERTYTYDTLAHPQRASCGTILFSFNVNSYDFLTPKTASLYRPHFFRVALTAM